MNRPDVLIMDEPSSGLDPLMQREFQAMMREVVAEGRTVFLSSHTLSEVQRVADRVGIIRHGGSLPSSSFPISVEVHSHRERVQFASTVEAAVFETLHGVRDMTVSDDHVTLSFDGQIETLFKVVTDGTASWTSPRTKPTSKRSSSPTTARRRGLMLANVYTKTIRDRWKGTAIAVRHWPSSCWWPWRSTALSISASMTISPRSSARS